MTLTQSGSVPFRFPTRLDRYLFFQLLEFFLLGLSVFTLVGFFSDTLLDFLKDIQRYGIPLETALTLVGLRLPFVFALVLPASVFLAVLIVFNNLNGQFELIAMRMNGISLRRLLLPAIILGLLCTFADYALIDYVVPHCKRQEEALKDSLLKQDTLPASKGGSFEFKQYDDQHRLKQIFYVGQVNQGQLRNVTMVDLSKPGILNVIQANRGERFPDRWELINANSYTVSQNKDMLFFSHIGRITKRSVFGEGATDKAATEAKRPFSYSSHRFGQLKKIIETKEQRGDEVAGIFYIKLWEKITLPLVCLIIVISAVPFAIRAPRQGADRGFVFALVVLFGFYLLRAICIALGQSGFFHLGGLLDNAGAFFIASWLPLVLIGGLGIGLLIRKSKVL
ncbi:MAG: LptF/LptG family permease [Candidatus Melainabacteria bacterium]|nr:LptF/LptG family permease [Candidatus Melainabacteria bacterium]